MVCHDKNAQQPVATTKNCQMAERVNAPLPPESPTLLIGVPVVIKERCSKEVQGR